jgi:hypothetical protein
LLSAVSETRACDEDSEIRCAPAPWQAWTECTERCDGGTKVRARSYQWGVDQSEEPADALALAQADETDALSLQSRAASMGSHVLLGLVLGVVAGRGYGFVQRARRRREAE